MGVLWAAVDERSGQSVAIRILERGVDDPRRVAHFRQSALAAARIAHPNLVRVLDEGVSPEVGPFIVTEWVDGVPLSAWRGHAPPWGFLRQVVLDICDALACVHARDLVHLDLRAGNVMVERTPEGPRARITDVGCARIDDGWEDRSSGARTTLKYLGTLRYMAPEAAEAPPWLVGPWSDLYALGLLVWEMLTGDIPLAHLDGMALLMRRTGSPPPVLPAGVGGAWHAHLAGLLARLLSAEPEERPRGAAQVRRTVEALGEPPVWVEPPARPRFRQAGFDRGAGRAGGFPLWRSEAGRPVGREQPMRELWRAVQAVVGGHGSRLVVLEGPPGAGRSHVVEAVCNHAVEHGQAQVWRAQFSRSGAPGSGLLGALEERMRTGASGVDGVVDRLERLQLLLGADAIGLEAVLPALLRPDPAPFVRPGNEPEPGVDIGNLGSAHMVAGTFLRLLSRAAQADAVIVWLEDAHFAPAAEGVDLVDRILSEHAGLSVCVVVTLRAGATGAEPFRTRFPPGQGVHWSQFAPLDESGLRTYVRERLALVPADEDRVLAAIQREPTLLRPIVDQALGALVQAAEGNALLPGTVLPETPEEIFAAQVRELPTAGLDALVPDVVTGLAFARLPLTPQVIKALEADDPHRPYARALAAAERARMVERRPLGGWTFVDPRLVGWLVARAGDRADSWHRRWSSALERLEAGGRGRLGIERAGHAEALGQAPQAIRSLLDAAAWALGPGQHAMERGLLAAQAATSLARALPDLGLAARGARLRAELLRQAGKEAAARQALEEAEALLGGLDAPLERGWCAWTGAWMEVDARELDAAMADFGEARLHFERAGFRAGVFWAWLGHARIHSLRGEHQAARTLARQAEAGFEELGAVRGQLASRYARAAAADYAGDFATADERYASLEALAVERRWLQEEATTRLHRARIALEMGRAANALRLMEAAEDTASAVRFARLGEWISAVRPAAYAALGDAAGAERALREARLPNPRLCATASQAILAGLRHPAATVNAELYLQLSRWANRVRDESR